MKIIYPLLCPLDNPTFDNDNLEEFITINNEKGIYVSNLKNKRIFYILQFKALEPETKLLKNGKEVLTGRQQFKIGIAHQPSSRLKGYYNSFGSNFDGKCCAGVKVLFLCGTDKNIINDPMTKEGSFQIEQLENKMKANLKKNGDIVRGSEWVLTKQESLLKMLKSYLPQLKRPTILQRKDSLRPLIPRKSGLRPKKFLSLL